MSYSNNEKEEGNILQANGTAATGVIQFSPANTAGNCPFSVEMWIQVLLAQHPKHLDSSEKLLVQ